MVTAEIVAAFEEIARNPSNELVVGELDGEIVASRTQPRSTTTYIGSGNRPGPFQVHPGAGHVHGKQPNKFSNYS